MSSLVAVAVLLLALGGIWRLKTWAAYLYIGLTILNVAQGASHAEHVAMVAGVLLVVRAVPLIAFFAYWRLTS